MSATTAQPGLDMDVLRTFVAICETGSFGRAAERVSRTPSAVSMQMKKLEETLGREMFMRVGRGVALTADGESLLVYARRILQLSEEAVARFVSPHVEGSVRLGAPDDFGTRLLPGILSRFSRTHPHVQVDVVLRSSPELIERINGGELDVVLVTAGHGHTRTPDEGEVLHSERLEWVGLSGGHAHTRDPLPMALANPGCAWRSMATSALESVGRAYRVAYSSELARGQEAAVLADLAVAPLPASVVQPPFCRVPRDAGLPKLGMYQIVLHKSTTLGPAGEALAQQIKAGFAEGLLPDYGSLAKALA